MRKRAQVFRNMHKAICTTTIFSPSYALRKFIKIAERDGWDVVIAGDKKTPHAEYKQLEKDHSVVTYLSPEDQEKINKKLSELIGWNCIQRRNFSYIYAIQNGAKIIATVDDDNIPNDSWGVVVHVDQEMDVPTYSTTLDVFDPLSVTNERRLWHRGYPIQYLSQKNEVSEPVLEHIEVKVQADLWDGAPDIDAVCRINHPEDVEFSMYNTDHEFFYRGDKKAPFNSQNTFLSSSVFPEYFLFPHIGRMDDIWAAYYVQEVFGPCVAFRSPSVFQKRNDHNVVKDMEAELIGYHHSVDVVRDGVLQYLPDRAIKAFEEYKTCF